VSWEGELKGEYWYRTRGWSFWDCTGTSQPQLIHENKT